MKPRIALSVLFVLIAATAFAQDATTTQSEAQQSFAKLKTLAGSWEGRVTSVPSSPDIENKHVHATLRVTSMGNAMVHEMTGKEDLTTRSPCLSGRRPPAADALL